MSGYWHCIIHFRDGRTRVTGSCNDRNMAFRQAQREFDQYKRTAISEFFEPTWIEIVEE